MFEIRFQGLMTHASVQHSVNLTKHQRVVLYTVPAMPHSALLTVHKDDLISPKEDFPNNDARCFRIKGVMSTNLPPGPPSPLSMSITGVISLAAKDVSGDPATTIKTPVIEIGDFKATADFSLFDVPDGTMFIRNWFKETALFKGNIYPAPRTVALTTPDPLTDIKFTIDNQAGHVRDILIKRSAKYVYITNAPVQAGHPSHWDAMSVFYDQTINPVLINNPVEVKTPPFALGGTDDGVDKCVEPQMLSVECANSSFP